MPVLPAQTFQGRNVKTGGHNCADTTIDTVAESDEPAGDREFLGESKFGPRSADGAVHRSVHRPGRRLELELRGWLHQQRAKPVAHLY